MDDATATQLILNRGSVFLEHLATGKVRLRLSVQGVTPREADGLREHFRAGATWHPAGAEHRSRWSAVSAQARGIVQWVQERTPDINTHEAVAFDKRIATLRLISPSAIDGGKGTRRARNTYDQS